jgi:RNA polymerase sigma-70 factor (sigma-E family)
MTQTAGEQEAPDARAGWLAGSEIPADRNRLSAQDLAESAVRIDELVAGLHKAHALALVRTAKLLLRDQQAAEDVVQDAFLSLYRALPRLRDIDQVVPYLRATVINGARSALRRQRRAALRPVQHEASESSAESAAMDHADHRAVLAAVARLPRRAREVLVLRYYLDLPEAEIAATLGVSRGTVSSTASRALAALERELREEL